jgi:hypothetical protein
MLRTLAALLVGVLVAAAPSAAEAATILVAPFVTVDEGDTFFIDVSVIDAVDLTSFQFDLSFDPSIVQANVAVATASPSLPGDWFFTSPGFVDNNAGQILGVSAFGSAINRTGPFDLARLEFVALAPGVSPLTFSTVFLNLEAAAGEDGQITVRPAVVPEPTTLVLLSSGVAMLAARRRSRTSGQNDKAKTVEEDR